MLFASATRRLEREVFLLRIFMRCCVLSSAEIVYSHPNTQPDYLSPASVVSTACQGWTTNEDSEPILAVPRGVILVQSATHEDAPQLEDEERLNQDCSVSALRDDEDTTNTQQNHSSQAPTVLIRHHAWSTNVDSEPSTSGCRVEETIIAACVLIVVC